jgi:hypothetical protein
MGGCSKKLGASMSKGFTRSPPPTSQQIRTRAFERFKVAMKALRDGELGKKADAEVKFAKHKPRGGLGVDESEKNMSDFDIAIKMQNFARNQFPDAKNAYDAMAQWLKTDAGKKVMQSFSRDVYERGQLKSAGYYTAPLGPGSGSAYHGAVGNGTGITDRSGYNNTYSASAADTRVGNSASPYMNAGSAVADKRHPALVTKANIDKLMKLDPKLSWDAAVTMLSRGGE